MKANAPEKIYLRYNHKGDIGAGWLIFPLTNNDIEYTRTDAFIEKAEKYLKSHFIKDVSVLAVGTVNVNFSAAIEKFVKYMKEE